MWKKHENMNEIAIKKKNIYESCVVIFVCFVQRQMQLKGVLTKQHQQQP